MIGRLSIRARLTAAFAVAMVLVLVLAGAFIYVRVDNDLSDSLNNGLRTRADDLSALVQTSGAEGPQLSSGRLVEGDEGFSQVLGSDGTVIASTLSPRSASALTPAEVERAHSGTVLIDEREVPGIEATARILARSAATPDGSFVVVAGASNEDRQEALGGLRSAFAIGAPLGIMLASVLGYLLAGRALRPVESMRRRAGEITLERSGERLPLPKADDEIHRLGLTLNQMLDRIEATLERERVFVADASHELRTPLSILRTELELATRPGRSPGEQRDALLSARDEVDRLSQLAEDLLVIARSDRGDLPIARERIELRTLLDRVRERFAARAGEAGRKIVVDAPEGERAELDPLRIEQAMGNLVENALRHGEGSVRLKAARAGDAITLEVSDDGAGFPAGFDHRAFERFSRGDEGRTGGGAGLGLAIVSAIAEAHGGTAAVTSNGDPQTTVRLTLFGEPADTLRRNA